jgi:hypothetical protein
MIPILIGSKKYKIKTISELNTAEFIELCGISELTTIKYIAWQCKINTDKAFFAMIDPVVEQQIGIVPDITKLCRPVLSYVDYKKTIATVGQRHQIEACNLTGFTLLVFVLAVSQAQSNNIDDVNQLQSWYMQQHWYEILPAGFFFYQNLSHGRHKGIIFSRLRQALINIVSRKKTQGQKN